MADTLLVGLADISEASGHAPQQLLGWADPNGWDPLRLQVYDGDRVQIRAAKLQSWLARNHRGGAGELVLRGWKTIASRAHKSPRSAVAASQRSSDPLPVQKDERTGEVWAYASAIDDWVEARTWTYAAHRVALSLRQRGIPITAPARARRRRRWTGGTRATLAAPRSMERGGKVGDRRIRA